eukprot:ctg_1321.g420
MAACVSPPTRHTAFAMRELWFVWASPAAGRAPRQVLSRWPGCGGQVICGARVKHPFGATGTLRAHARSPTRPLRLHGVAGGGGAGGGVDAVAGVGAVAGGAAAAAAAAVALGGRQRVVGVPVPVPRARCLALRTAAAAFGAGLEVHGGRVASGTPARAGRPVAGAVVDGAGAHQRAAVVAVRGVCPGMAAAPARRLRRATIAVGRSGTAGSGVGRRRRHLRPAHRAVHAFVGAIRRQCGGRGARGFRTSRRPLPLRHHPYRRGGVDVLHGHGVGCGVHRQDHRAVAATSAAVDGRARLVAGWRCARRGVAVSRRRGGVLCATGGVDRYERRAGARRGAHRGDAVRRGAAASRVVSVAATVR